jgi:hypothetical protein
MEEWDEDSPRVFAALREDEALCIPCLVNKTGITKARIERILTSLGKIVHVRQDVAVCDRCHLMREIFRVP